MGRGKKKLSYHKLVETKSKSDYSGGGIPNLQVNRIPLKRVSHHPSHIHLELSSLVRLRLLEVESGRLKLSKEQFKGEILNLSDKGMLISTKYHIPDEEFLLATLVLDQTITLEGVLGKIKKVEFQDSDDLLVGVEFSSLDDLKEVSSLSEIEKLRVKPINFKRKLHDIINHHLHKDEIVPHSKRSGDYHGTFKTEGDSLIET
jgi:hypothetical protein